LIWAADGAQLGLVEGVIGATTFGGGTQRLAARAGAGRAAEAVLTARTYPAETMRDWGVVSRVLPAGELREKAHAFARRLAEGPTLAHAATKRMIQLAVDEGGAGPMRPRPRSERA
jgi:enoyl-CoA hydratase/carnithine racemase